MQVTTQDTQATVDLNEVVFNYNYNEGLVHQAVVAYMNGARSGNSAQKTRSDVRGGGRKPWKQKGTGRARAGTIRSPLWRSGGVTFASKPRDYSQKLNKKMYIRAMRSIFSELHRQNRLTVLSEFQIASPKTKDFVTKINELKLNNALIIMKDLDVNEYLSARNVPKYEVTDVHTLNPVDLLAYDSVVVTVDALKHIEEMFQ